MTSRRSDHQRLRPQRLDSDTPELTFGKIGVEAIEGDGVDLLCDLFKGAGTAEASLVGREGGGSRTGGFAAEDEGTFHSNDGAVELILGDSPLGGVDAIKLGAEDLQGLVGTFRGGADIRSDGTELALTTIAGGNGIAEATLFSHF